MRRPVLFLSLTLIALAGCSETQDRPVSPQHHPIVASRPQPEKVDIQEWVRIFIGPLPHPDLAGYVCTKRPLVDGKPREVHWVYDADWKLVGVMSENGLTTRFDRQGAAHDVGYLPTEQGLLSIYDYDTGEHPIHFVPMPEPKR